MKLRRVVPALLLLVVSVALSAPAVADVNARIVRLSYLDGDVQIDRRDGQGFENAMMNMPVVQGTRLWTREQGLAEIELEDGSTVRLTPNTLIEAQQMSLRGGDTVNLFDMQEGTAYFDIHGDDDDHFTLALPGHQLRLRKGSRFRVTAERNELRVAVFKGEVELSGRAVNRVVVKKGESLSLDPFEDGRYFLSRDIVSEYYDTWDQERDEYRSTYARRSAYTGYSNVYYGASDLHYWGNYNYLPGWGWVWRPYYVGSAWNPWNDGAWVWYPGWGYTWVSAYPWGWMPYHYGSWVWISSHGWCWRPGGWRNWSRFTVARHVPHGFAVPLPPHRGRGRVVVVGDGGRTVYPGGDRGFMSGLKAAKDAASGTRGSRPLLPGSKGVESNTTGGGVTTGSKSSGGLVGGRKATIDAGTGDGRGGRDAYRDTASKPRSGRTVMDSRVEPDNTGGRDSDALGGRRTGTTDNDGRAEQWSPRTKRETTYGGDVSNDGGVRGGDSAGGRSTGGARQESPSRVSPPPPAPPARQVSPPPPRTSPPPRESSPAGESRSRSTPSMSFDGGRSSGGGSRFSSSGMTGGSRSSAPSSGGSRGSLGRTSGRGPR